MFKAKHFAAVFIALALLLTACGKSDPAVPSTDGDGTVELTSVDPKVVDEGGELSYAAKGIAFSEPVSPVTMFLFLDNSVLLYGDDPTTGNFLREADFSGSITKNYSLDFLSDSETFAPLGVDGSGRLWLIVTGESADRTETYYRYGILNSDGSFTEQFSGSSEDGLSIGSMQVDGDKIYMRRDNTLDGSCGLAICALDGSVEHEFKIPFSFVFKLDGGTVYLSSDSLGADGGCTVSKLDLESGELTELCSFDTGYFAAVSGDTIYINDPTSVFAYSLSTGTTTPLFTWSSLNITQSGLYPLGDGSGSFLSAREGSLCLIYPDTPDDRRVLVLASGADSAMFNSAVLGFNANDPDYKIVIKDYSAYPNAQDVISTELISGGGPDIIDLTAFSDDLSGSGVLADLVPYFNIDPDYSLDMLLEKPLAVMMNDGRLTSFIPFFTVGTFICPQSCVPDGGFSDVRDFEARIGDVHTAFGGMLTRGKFLKLAFSADYPGGYSADDVAAILRIAKQLPESVAPPVADSPQPLYTSVNIGGVPPFRYYRVQMNGNVAIAGMPFVVGKGGLLMPVIELGMNANSDAEAREGVWRFFRSFLAPESYIGAAGNYFSLTKAGYEYALEADRKNVDEGMSISMLLSGRNVTLEIADTNDHTYVYELINNLHGVYRSNSTLYGIVSDSAAKYFAGDADEYSTADVILSKLRVYTAERS